MHLRIGSRGSKLAVLQTKLFIKHLKGFLDFTHEIVIIKTTGDKVLDKPLYDIGGKALFIKELETALLEKTIDFAVHSLKDVPGKIDDKFKLSGFIGREYPLDCFVSKAGITLENIKEGAVIGTSSPRRKAFLKKIRPDLDVRVSRGNVGTRISKLDKGEFDALLLAESGLKRLNMFDPSYMHIISPDLIIPAVCQGVIAAQTLKTNLEIINILNNASDRNILDIIMFEREFLLEVNADCDVPVAGYIEKKSEHYNLRFMMATSDCKKMEIAQKEISSLSALEAKEIAKELKAKLQSAF
jgi:hydroxymethylbilane synthase